MKYKKITRIVIVFLIAFYLNIGYSQDPLNSIQVQEQLRSKGISEDQLAEFLETKNLSIDNVENLSPDELFDLNQELDLFILGKKKGRESSKTILIDTIPMQEKQEDKIQEVSKKDEKIVLKSEENNPIIQRYGEQLFLNNSLNLTKIGSNTPVAGKYILNVGDQVSVSIYGRSKLDQVYTIDENGAIFYDNGNRRLLLAGTSLNQARVQIEKVFAQIYSFSKGEINVNVFSTSTIAVNIYGEVSQPGGYLISAVNSPINVIQAAQGITKNGSYRNIKLLKDNGTDVKIDLYQFLNSPESMPSISLSNNDIIHVPSVQKDVSLVGAVIRPMQYELLESESVQSLISYAGGYQRLANRDIVQIERIVDNENIVIDVNMKSNEANSFKLLNGDIVRVQLIKSEVNNLVVVEGEVNNPGTYELSRAMKVSDLLSKLTFNSGTRTDLALLNRTNSDGTTQLIKINISEIIQDKNNSTNIELMPNDKLLIWGQQRFKDGKSTAKIYGAVRFPGVYPLDISGETTLNDVATFAGGISRDASDIGMIYRKNPKNDNYLEYIRIKPLTAQNSSELNLKIMPFDSIYIYQNEKIQNTYSVEIVGQVNRPGIYTYGENMSLKDLIALGEGFKLAAFTEQIEVNRIIMEDNTKTEVKVAVVKANKDLNTSDDASNYKLQPFDKVYVRAIPEFEYQKVITISGEVKFPGKYVLENRNEKLMEIIQRAGGLTKEAFEEGAILERKDGNVGRVIMNLTEAEKSSKSKYNYILLNGDEIYIPKQKDIVSLKSETLSKRVGNLDEIADNTISMAYFSGKSADYYINEFGGGFGENSDRKGVFVQHANGEIARTKDYFFYLSYPEVRKGSLIVIPEKDIISMEQKEEEKVDWTKLLNDSVAQAMSILTLLLLVERI